MLLTQNQEYALKIFPSCNFNVSEPNTDDI